jgi:hypothetical protein
MINPDRWYHFKIWERDLETPSHSFVGKRIQELQGKRSLDALYQDQEGNWYYSYQDFPSKPQNDLVKVHSESADCGRTFEELKENMKDWVEQVCHGVWPEIVAGTLC